MLLVKRHLYFAAALRLINRAPHGVGYLVGIHDYLTGYVSRSSADRLDERPMVAQEALFVGIQNGNEGDLGKVKALAQQVDANQHIELTATQIAQYLNALECSDVGVHIPGPDALIEQMVG